MNKLYAVLFICLSTGSAAWAPAADPQQARPLTLQEAVQMAVAHSPDVLLAKVRTAQAGEALQETRSLNRPQVTVGTGLAYNNGFPLSIEGAAPSLVEFAASQSVLSKKNNNLIREAEASRKASEIGSDAARNELTARVAQVYNELHQARKADALWSERLAALEKEQQVVATQLEAGRMRPVDLTLARTAVEGARQQLMAAQEAERLAAFELRQLTKLPEGTEIQTTEPEIDGLSIEVSTEALFQRAVEARPEILQAQADVRAREFHLEATRGEKYPEIALVSEYSLFSRTNNYQNYFRTFTRNNFLVGLSLQYPLFNGFRTQARIGQSRQEVEAARLQLERLKSALRLDIERDVSALKLARGAVEVARQEVAAARESIQVDETLLEAGRMAFKDLQVAQSQLADKQIAALDAEKALFQRKVDLLRATGTIGQALVR